MKILIMPGLDGTGNLLSGIKEILAIQHNVIVLRYPPDLWRYTDLLVWAERRMPKDDFIIVAESFSGPIAIMLASKQPQNLKGVIGVATFAKPPRRFPALLTYAIELLPITSKLLAWLAQPFLMGKWSSKEFTSQFQKSLSTLPVPTIAGRLREVLALDLSVQASELSVPIMYLRAMNDRLIPPDASLDFKRSNGTVVDIEGPHFLLQASPKASANQILKFASRFN